MLLEIAMGDAYGAGFEFAPRLKIQAFNTLKSYHSRTWSLAGRCGYYTDDTQMSLALTELLLAGEDWTPLTIARYFLDAFKRDVRKGYARRFYHFLCETNTAEEFLKNIRPDSTRNGAAMRAAPLGVIANLDELLEKSALQATVTHNTFIGVQSAQAVALMAHYILYGVGKKENLLEFVAQYTQQTWSQDWKGEVACCGLETVNAILTVLNQSDGLSDILLRSVNLGGDVDTVAAVSLGLAHLSTEYQQDLPAFLYDDLENGRYGRAYLIEKGQQLLRLVKV